MGRSAGVITTGLVPALQLEATGDGSVAGSSFSIWRDSCTQYSSHLFPWIMPVFQRTPQKFYCGVAWEKQAHIMSARICILNAPFKMISRPYYSKMEIFKWEQLHFLTLLCCGLAETHCGKAWRSICRKNDINKRWRASKNVTNGHDHSQREILLSHHQIQLPAAKPGSGGRVLLSQSFSWGHLSWWNLFKPSPLEHLGHITEVCPGLLGTVPRTRRPSGG